MPRKKIVINGPDYTDIGKNPETHLIQKANPLLSLSQTSLTLAEFKILDAYLAKIDSRNPSKRFVQLEKGKLEEYLGVTQIKPDDLEKRIRNLFQTVKIYDPNKQNGFTLISLFEKADCSQDSYGKWQISLACTSAAMEYFFNIEEIGYIRYKLRSIISLSSRYSYVLFLYLEQNRHMHLTWEISFEDLKKVLCCTAERYNQFKFFNADILKKANAEINSKTDCRFSYETIKTGRWITGIRFKLESKALPYQMTEKNRSSNDDDKNTSANRNDCFWLDALVKSDGSCEFVPEQMEDIKQLVLTLPKSKLPSETGIPDDLDFGRYHYLAQKYSLLNAKAYEIKIANRYSYFRKMIVNDIYSN